MHQIVSKMMFLFLAPPTGNGTFLRRSPHHLVLFRREVKTTILLLWFCICIGFLWRCSQIWYRVAFIKQLYSSSCLAILCISSKYWIFKFEKNIYNIYGERNWGLNIEVGSCRRLPGYMKPTRPASRHHHHHYHHHHNHPPNVIVEVTMVITVIIILIIAITLNNIFSIDV